MRELKMDSSSSWVNSLRVNFVRLQLQVSHLQFMWQTDATCTNSQQFRKLRYLEEVVVGRHKHLVLVANVAPHGTGQ